MAWSTVGASRRVLDAMVAVCAVAVIVSGTSLARAWRALADDGPVPLPNPDLVERCGIPVVMALDASPMASDGDPALAAAVSGAARAVAAELSGWGSTLGVLAYDGSARWLTDSVHPPTAEDAALAPDGPLGTALAAYGTPPPEGGTEAGGRSWAVALAAVGAALDDVPGAHPALVLHVTTGTPDDGPGGPDDAVARAAAVADRLRALPGTHLLTLAVGPAADLSDPLTAISGPDVVAAGARPLDVERDDVVTVGDPGAAPAAAAELARALCRVDLEVTVRADAASVGLPGVALAVEGHGEQTTDATGVAHWRIDPPHPVAGADPHLTLRLWGGPTTAVCGQGRDTPVDVTSDPTADPAGPPGGIVLTGLLAGGTVRCELREADLGLSGLIEPPAASPPAAGEQPVAGAPPLEVAPLPGDPTAATPVPPSNPADATPATVGASWEPDTGGAASSGAASSPDGAVEVDDAVLLGADASCPTDGVAGSSVVIAAMGDPVTHCLVVRNTGQQPLTDVVVESSELGLLGDGAWRPDGPLAPGDTTRLAVTVTLERMTAVRLAVRARAAVSGSDVTGTARALTQVTAPAIGVSRALAVAGSSSDAVPCGVPVGHVRNGRRVDWCTTITNTGGTFLDEVTVIDPALLPTPLPVAARLAPGASITVHGSARLAGDGLGGPSPIARALPVERNGRPVAGSVEVASDQAHRPGLNVDASLDATHVPVGDEVTLSVTVSNDAEQPIDEVDVEDSLCGEAGEPTAQLLDNGDDRLDDGEQWVYVCSAAIYSETLAVASIVTPAQTTNTRPTAVAPDEAEMRVKKSQRDDLRLANDTSYELKIQNLGNIPAANVVLTDTLPAGTRFVSATSDAGSCGESGGTVTCQLGTLPPQLDLEANFVHIVVAAEPTTVGQVLTNEAKVSTSSKETDFRQNTSSIRGKVFAVGECAGSRDCDPTLAVASESDDGSSSSGEESDSLPFSDGMFTGVSDSLATTGADPDLVAAWGVVFLASGMSLVAAARRRHRLTLAGVTA